MINNVDIRSFLSPTGKKRKRVVSSDEDDRDGSALEVMSPISDVKTRNADENVVDISSTSSQRHDDNHEDNDGDSGDLAGSCSMPSMTLSTLEHGPLLQIPQSSNHSQNRITCSAADDRQSSSQLEPSLGKPQKKKRNTNRKTSQMKKHRKKRKSYSAADDRKSPSQLEPSLHERQHKTHRKKRKHCYDDDDDKSESQKSKFLDDEASYESSFIDDGSVDESDPDAIDLAVKDSARAMRNRRSYSDIDNMCVTCKHLRNVFLRVLGLS